MNENIDWNLLAKYLFGECSEEEAAEVEAWLEEDPRREMILQELRVVQRMTRESSSPEAWDTEALWNRVQKQTRPEETEKESAEELFPQPSGPRDADRAGRSRTHRRLAHSRTRRSFARKAVMVVGVLALAVGAVLWLRTSFNGEPETASAPEAKTFATKKGQRATVRLTDGTRVRLNVNSRLTVQASFGEERRTVQLKGEAFFEVSEDSTRPFIVRTRGAIARVLGTSFDVSAYGDEGTRVVVTEGQVALHPEGTSSEKSSSELEEKRGMVLTKHQIGRVLRSGEQVVRRERDVRPHLAWMEGQLVFKEAPFEEVSRKLERWYDLTVTLEEGTASPPGHLNARFAKDQSLREVLSVIATAFGLEYERHRKRVMFVHPEE